MKLTRRELVPFTLSLAAACASPVPPATAQQRRPPPPRAPQPPPPSLPDASQADDIGGIAFTGSDATAGTLVMIGHAFPAGALPRGHGIAARLDPGGQAVPVQMQVLRRYPDGSVRMAMLGLEVPTLPEGRHGGVVLSRRPPDGQSP